MSCLRWLLSSVFLMSITSSAFAGDDVQQRARRSDDAEKGRLVSACADPSWQGNREHCALVTRYIQPGMTLEKLRAESTTPEQIAVEAALGERKTVQPVQLSGDQAVALVAGKSVEFDVVFLHRDENRWQIVRVVEAPDTGHTISRK